MKSIYAFSLLLLVGVNALRADEITVSSKVNEVTVYRAMARETRTATFNASKGSYDIVLSDISVSMVDASLQVGVKGPATLLSATVRTNYFNPEETNKIDPAEKRLRDSIQTMTEDLLWIAEQKKIIRGEVAIIDVNNKLGSQHEAMKPAELIALADLYRIRMTDLRKKEFGLTKKETELALRKQKYESQLAELGSKPKDPVKEIVLSFSSETAAPVNIQLNYLISQAGWRPMYDMKVVNTSQPVNLEYKAGVYQQSGMDWKDIKLKVSTANPNRTNDRPILNPLFLDYITYRAVRGANAPASNSGAVMNMMQEGKSVSLSRDEDYNSEIGYEVGVNDNGMSVEFDIDAKQKIKSDGKEHVCRIQSYKIPATYKYHVVPKLDASAFLLARITEYGQYNLLAGQANIFFDDMYVGQTQLNPSGLTDTLLVSLGRDESVVVRRTKIADKTSKKFLSDSQKETYGWEITVRNNKTSVLDIDVLDQIPISRQEAIKVELIDKSGATYTEEYGKLLWNLKLQPNTGKTLKLVYSVEYPKGKQIQEY